MNAVDWTELEPGDVVEATVRIRRGPMWTVKPNAEAIDGVRCRFRYGFTMFPTETPYPGEVAMTVPVEVRDATGIDWVASGDLVDAVMVDSVTLLAFDGGGPVGPIPVQRRPAAIVVVSHVPES